MTILELIKELLEYPMDHVVHCSVACDDYENEIERRVFGCDCRGVNPHKNQAVLLFDLESMTFTAEESQ